MKSRQIALTEACGARGSALMTEWSNSVAGKYWDEERAVNDTGGRWTNANETQHVSCRQGIGFWGWTYQDPGKQTMVVMVENNGQRHV